MKSKLEMEDRVGAKEDETERREEVGDDAGGVGTSTTLSSLVSDLVNGRKIENLEEDEIKESDDDRREKEGNDHGFISNIISNLIHPKEQGEDTSSNGNIFPSEDKENDIRTKDEEKNGSGGIIDNIVSYLPKSLTDDVDPATDEASILIHSIVRD